jgi:hypothetical protein
VQPSDSEEVPVKVI